MSLFTPNDVIQHQSPFEAPVKPNGSASYETWFLTLAAQLKGIAESQKQLEVNVGERLAAVEQELHWQMWDKGYDAGLLAATSTCDKCGKPMKPSLAAKVAKPQAILTLCVNPRHIHNYARGSDCLPKQRPRAAKGKQRKRK